jgi:hypothetical protein
VVAVSEAVRFDPGQLPLPICDQCGEFIEEDRQQCYACDEGVECSP